MEMKTNAKNTIEKNIVTEPAVIKEKKEKKPRAEPIAYRDVSNVERLVRDGKGTIEDLVAAGVPARVAGLALRKLKKEGVIKESFVISI